MDKFDKDTNTEIEENNETSKNIEDDFIPQDEIDKMLTENEDISEDENDKNIEEIQENTQLKEEFSTEKWEEILEKLEAEEYFEFADSIYYPHIADWCNKNKAFINSINPEVTGTFYVEYYKETPLTPMEQLEQLKNAVITTIQEMMDKKAREKGYDNGFALASYIMSTDEIFKQEAEKFVGWRDKCWRYCYTQIDLYLAGKRDFSGLEAFISELPTLEWE